MTKKTFHEILTALSLANLLFLTSWRELLYPVTFDYHIEFGPNPLDFLSVVLCVVLTAALLFGSVQLLRNFFGEKVTPLINLTFLLSILIAVNIFRIQFLEKSNSLLIGSIFQALVLSTLVVSLTKWRSAMFNFARMLVLMFSPFVLITFSQSFWGMLNPPAAANETPVSAQLANVRPNAESQVKNRVIWIIFDELDYRVPFELKPLELPEFERLKSESLTATNAKSPASTTLESLPSLLTGKKVGKTETFGKSELILSFTGGETGKFTREPNIFYDVKALNGNISALGWHHPYCRLFGKILSVCQWEGDKFSKNLSLPETMLVNFEDLIAQMPSMLSVEAAPSLNRFKKEKNHVFTQNEFNPAAISAAHQQRLGEIKAIASNPSLDLVFFHLPLPHAPVQYNRLTGQFTAERQDYINNLALCDIILGEIRQSMEQANLWENSTVIVTSDHQWRIKMWKEQIKDHKFAITDNDLALTQGIEDPRVPFFIKLKNQKESITYEDSFNTLVTRDLILAIMKGEIASPEELKARLASQSF